jgi:hypothetical protein
VRLEFPRAEQDPGTLAAQAIHAAAEGLAGGQGGVDERQDNDGEAGTQGFGEDSEGVGVADAAGPFVDGVVGSGGDDDRVCRAGPGFSWLPVGAAGRGAGLLLEGGGVDEVQRGRGGDELDIPAVILGCSAARLLAAGPSWLWTALIALCAATAAGVSRIAPVPPSQPESK